MVILGPMFGCFSWSHLKSFQHAKLQVVPTAPKEQLFNKCRLRTLLDKANDSCIACSRCSYFQMCNHWCREEQGEEHTSLGSFSTVGQGTRCDFPQPHLLVLPACQETWVSTDGWKLVLRAGEFGVEDFWDDGVECRVDVHKLRTACCTADMSAAICWDPQCSRCYL